MLRLCWALTRMRSEAIALRSAFKVDPVSSAPGWATCIDRWCFGIPSPAPRKRASAHVRQRAAPKATAS